MKILCKELTIKIVCTVSFLALSLMTYAQSQTPAPQSEQEFYRWELSGGYSHVTGYQGLDGFNVGGSFFLAPKISLGVNYDGVYDTTTLGAFALTNVGLLVSKSHLQDLLTGPRIYFPGLFKGKGNIKGHILNPFVETQFGESHLYSKLEGPTFGTRTSSDTEFTWLLGGGGDFSFSNHFAARINADFLRTHFVDSGQSHLRIILGLVGKF